MFDIAINQNNEIYIAKSNNIIHLNSSCIIQNTFTNSLINGAVNSLSFDRSNNMYLGGFDSKVYRYNNGDFNQLFTWHNFNSGKAAGDFVMKGDKMYVAWKLDNTECRLYEVSVDSNTNYVSHVDLGPIPNNTYGLASELGSLYGVAPHQLYKINVNNMTFETILNNTSTSSWYGAAGKNEAINLEVNVFETEANAQNNTNPLPQIWTNTVSGGQTVYVTVTNTINGQTIIVPVDIVINLAPKYTSPIELANCENVSNPHDFNLRATESDIVGSQSNIVTSFHTSQNDANSNINPLPDTYTTSSLSQSVFVRLTNTVTGCYSVFSFLLKVSPKPTNIDFRDLTLCNNNSSINITLSLSEKCQVEIDRQIANGNSVTFHDSQNDAILNINPLGDQLTITSAMREVFVRVANSTTGCFDYESFKINVLQETQNSDLNVQIQINDWTSNNNCILIAGLDNNFECSLDGINYQKSPYFYNLAVGKYNVYIKNNVDCTIYTDEVVLLMYPKFFTPNGDGYNDYWKIDFSEEEPNMTILIYDRFGKLLKNLSSNEIGWDGKFSENVLPSSDYWFVVKRQSGKEYKGHFTLKR